MKRLLLIPAILGMLTISAITSGEFDLQGLNQQVQHQEQVLDNHEARINNLENNNQALQNNLPTPNPEPTPEVTTPEAKPAPSTVTQPEKPTWNPLTDTNPDADLSNPMVSN